MQEHTRDFAKTGAERGEYTQKSVWETVRKSMFTQKAPDSKTGNMHGFINNYTFMHVFNE